MGQMHYIGEQKSWNLFGVAEQLESIGNES
jgi:hypothetical protein